MSFDVMHGINDSVKRGHLLSGYIDLQCKVRILLKISTHREMDIEAFLKKFRVDFAEIFNSRNSAIGNEQKRDSAVMIFGSTRENMSLY